MDELRAWRLQREWSQRRLAEELGVDVTTVKRWERGLTVPYPVHLEALARLGFAPETVTEIPERKEITAMEQPSTYFVEDRGNQLELLRLVAQDTLFTRATGGVLAEHRHPERIHRLLDVACGTGGWLVETARTYPMISTLIGVDISKTMLDYARTRASEAGVSERVEFLLMDALRMLEFPDKHFDLVNMRLAMSFLRTWDWPKLLQEFRRVTRPGGMVCITETLLEARGTESAMRLHRLFREALTRAGHAFPDGFAATLPALLERHGFQRISQKRYEPVYTNETPEGRLCIEDITNIFRTGLPFLHKWTTVPDDYEEIYQQMLEEMARPDFRSVWPILTVWGVRGPY